MLNVENGQVDSNPAHYDHTDNFENQMTNGSSFNYADENDSVHEHLDVDPPAIVDPEVRDNVNWGIPNSDTYDYNSDNQDDDYSVWENSGTVTRR